MLRAMPPRETGPNMYTNIRDDRAGLCWTLPSVSRSIYGEAGYVLSRTPPVNTRVRDAIAAELWMG